MHFSKCFDINNSIIGSNKKKNDTNVELLELGAVDEGEILN
jgi:hypothetical protein